MTALPDSACQTCRRPGRCCVGLSLNNGSFPRGQTPEEARAALKSVVTVDGPNGPLRKGLPFEPLWRTPSGEWRLWCPNLSKEGRCTDYENRPFACRSYVPGSTSLCAEWDGVP